MMMVKILVCVCSPNMKNGLNVCECLTECLKFLLVSFEI